MKLTQLPFTGTVTLNHDTFYWKRFETYPNTLVLRKEMEAENPVYEAHIHCPNGEIDLDNFATLDVSVASISPDGGESPLNPAYIDQFTFLLEFLREKYDNALTPPLS